jgi:hypothetical protein
MNGAPHTWRTRAASRAALRSFTLVELVVSSAVAGLLMLGLASAVMLVGRAIPDEASTPSSVSSAASVVDALARDLQYAQSVIERGNWAVEFTVPDRTADKSPETIRYEWDGKPGSPLIWTYNGKSAELAPTVVSLTFTPEIETVTTSEQRTTTTTGSETLLASFTGWSGISSTATDYRITATRWIANVTSLSGAPNGTTSIQFTRARFRMRDASASTSVTVGLYETAGASAATPAFLSLGTPITFAPGALSYWFYSTVEVAFTGSATTAPGRQIALLTKGDATQPRVQYLYSTAAPADASVMLFTSDSGGSWTPSVSQLNYHGMPFELYGICTVETTQTVDVTRYYVRSIRVALRLSDDPAAEVSARISLLNAPEVVSP